MKRQTLSLPDPLDAKALRQLALDCGADDAGCVALNDPALDDQRADILAAFPFARSLLSFVVKMNRENVRSPARSVANVEFHRAGDDCDEIASDIAGVLERRGVRAGFPAMAFPMEAQNWPRKMWVVSHKPIAVAAGLGRMGFHRNVIHPKFGNFILLGTVALDFDAAPAATPLDFNPCFECKLCVAACPTGAVAPDGHFDFAACYTHNYREFMGGFGDWVETIAGAESVKDFRSKMSDVEVISMWQSLAFGPNYKAAYCMAVCPAGEEVIGPYLADKKGFRDELVKPLRECEETIYVTPGSDAEDYVRRHFPHKRAKRVGSGLRASTIAGFLESLRYVFQREQSKGLNAVYHFVFTGAENARATVVIGGKKIQVTEELSGRAQLKVTADSRTWLRFLRKDVSMPLALITGKVRLWGDPGLLLRFAKCFPQE